MEAGETRLADLDRFRVSHEEARRAVDDLVQDAGALGEVLRSGTLAERKVIVRGLTQEIVFDPRSGTGTAVFHRVPVAAATQGAGGGNDERTRLLRAASSRRAGAGAGSSARVTTEPAEELVELRVFEVRRRRRGAA